MPFDPHEHPEREYEYDDFDEAAYDEDMQAQNAVDDAKYEMPEQDPDDYRDDDQDDDDMPVSQWSRLAESVVGYSESAPF